MCRIDENSTCIFPFEYQGRTYKTCTYDHSNEGIPWCMTNKTVKNGHDTKYIESWADCPEKSYKTNKSCPHDHFSSNRYYINKVEINICRLLK